MSWKAFRSNDHAISYLADKHLAAKRRSHREKVPTWLWNLGKLTLWGFVGFFIVSALLVAPKDPFFALMPVMMLLLYGPLFFGIYRVWNLSSVVSSMKNGRSLSTVLSTGIGAAELVDAVAGKCFREILKWMAFPFSLAMAAMAFMSLGMASEGGPGFFYVLSMIAVFALLLLFYSLTGAFAVLVIHSGMGETGPRGFGAGFGMILVCVYGPMLALLPLLLLPYGEQIFTTLFFLWFFCLPLTFRKLSIYGVNRVPIASTRTFSLKALVKGGWKPVLTIKRVPAFITDANLIFARCLADLNLFSVVGLVLFLGLGGPFLVSVTDHLRGPSWMMAHFLTWVGSGMAALLCYQLAGVQVSSETSGGRLDALRSTPFPVKKVVDGWASYSFLGPISVVAPAMAYLLPSQFRLGSVLFVTSLCVAATYLSLSQQLNDKVGRWMCVLAVTVFGLCWVLIPFLLQEKIMGSYLPLVLPTALFAWFARTRALKAYRYES